jgi:hypothetical protein
MQVFGGGNGGCRVTSVLQRLSTVHIAGSSPSICGIPNYYHHSVCLGGAEGDGYGGVIVPSLVFSLLQCMSGQWAHEGAGYGGIRVPSCVSCCSIQKPKTENILLFSYFDSYLLVYVFFWLCCNVTR